MKIRVSALVPRREVREIEAADRKEAEAFFRLLFPKAKIDSGSMLFKELPVAPPLRALPAQQESVCEWKRLDVGIYQTCKGRYMGHIDGDYICGHCHRPIRLGGVE